MKLGYKAITLAAKRHHVTLDVNNSSLFPSSFRQSTAENYCVVLKLARQFDVPVVVSSNSHVSYDVGILAAL